MNYVQSNVFSSSTELTLDFHGIMKNSLNGTLDRAEQFD